MNSRLIDLGLKKKNKEIKTSWKDIGEEFGLSAEEARQAVKRYCKTKGILPGKYEKGKERVLIFSDLHVPYHNEELILSVVKKYSNVNLIIINGDILDCKAVSSWYDENITILDYEIIKAHELLEKIRTITKARIMLVKGNHEERVNKHFAKNAKVLGSAVVETEILYKLAYGFDIRYVETGQRIHYNAIPNVDYCEARSFEYGELLVNHPTIFRKDNLKTTKEMYEQCLRVRHKNARVIITAHTHQLGLCYYEDDKILIESGCLCLPATYSLKEDRPMKIEQYGCVYLEMKDKKVIPSSIKLDYLGNSISEFDIEDDY